jgi:uncharacterized repeat protein (TIGR02543 family)
MKIKNIIRVVCIGVIFMSSYSIVSAIDLRSTYTMDVNCTVSCPDEGLTLGTYQGQITVNLIKKIFLRDERGRDVGLAPMINIGATLRLDERDTTGTWFETGGLYDSPPADGRWYKVLDQRMWSRRNEVHMVVSEPKDTNQIRLESSNTNVVTCNTNERTCTAVGAGTADIRVIFPNTDQTGKKNWLGTNKIIGSKNGFGLISYKAKGMYTETYNSRGGINYGQTWFDAEVTGTNIKIASKTYGFNTMVFGVIVLPDINYGQSTSINSITPTKTSAQITWTYQDPENDPQLNYQLQIATNSSFTNIVQQITAPQNTNVSAVRSYNVTGLNSGTTYYARIRTYNQYNAWGAYTVPRSFTTIADVPPVTSCSSITNVTSNSATVNWTYQDPENDPQTGYHVQVFNNSSFTGTPIAQGLPNPTTQNPNVASVRSWTTNGLTSDTTYYARISTYNNVNGWSPGWRNCSTSFKTLAGPYSITYNANGATSGTAPASQTKTHGVNITLASNSGNLFKTGYAFSGWNTNASSTGINYAAGSIYSTNSALTLFAKWNRIPTPTSANATCSANGTQLTISWTPPTGYNSINFRVSPSSSWTTSGWGDRTLWASNVTGTTRTVTVTPGTQYNWWVETYAGSSNYSTAIGRTITCTNTNLYSITFDGNNETAGSMNPLLNLTPGSSFALPPNGFVRTGYTFSGWATTTVGSARYADRAQYTDIRENITLYAKWDQTIVCPSGSSNVSGTCVCTNGATNPNEGCNTCPAGQYMINSICGVCSANQTYDSENKICIDNDQFGDSAQINTFRFFPNIADSSNTCPLYVNVDTVEYCELISRNGGSSYPISTTSAFEIVSEGQSRYPVGTYTLSCRGTDDSFSTSTIKSCYINSDTREQ